MDNTQRVLSLCTGLAGIELGLRRAGTEIKPVCYIENEVYAQANLVKNIEKGWLHSAPIFSCVKTFDAKPLRNKIHGLTGGYPCSPFSNGGKRKGEKDPRHLWPHIKKHIKDAQPHWVFFENTYGHITLGLETVIEDLQRNDYRVQVGIFSASECLDSNRRRAPQQRKRVFILGCKKAYAMGYAEYFGLSSTTQENRAERESQARWLQEFERRCNKPSVQFEWVSPPSIKQRKFEEPRLAPFKCELGRERTGLEKGLDAIANRTDRMIMLGNAVIPQVAEKAWLSLWYDMIAQ